LIGIYIFGGQMLKEFAIAMTFAIVMGTATSIYISNVILYHFNLRDTKY
jgi:preprotein translocase subunit SecF